MLLMQVTKTDSSYYNIYNKDTFVQSKKLRFDMGTPGISTAESNKLVPP